MSQGTIRKGGAAEEAGYQPHDPLIEQFVKEYGSCTLAYSTLQPGVQHFLTEWGFQAYQRRGGISIAMGNPIGDPEHFENIVSAFLEAHPRPSYWQVTEPVARILEGRGFYVNHIGADMELDLRNYDFSGKKKQKLRQAMRRWSRQEQGDYCEIREMPFSEIDMTSINELSTAWKKTRVVRRQELRFLTRPAVFDDEIDVRKFFAFQNGTLQGFVFFDPIYRGRSVIGYSTATKRRLPGAPNGVEEAITGIALQKFQLEGLEVLSLGLLPFYQLDDTGFRSNRLLGLSFRFWERFGNRVMFNFRGHNDFKHRFRGKIIKVYHASPVWENTYRMLCFNSVSGVGMLSRFK